MALDQSSPLMRPAMPRTPEFAAAMARAERTARGETEQRSPEDVMASIEAAVNEETLQNARRGLGLGSK